MELVAGPQSVLDGVLVVRSMEVEKVDTIGLQPLQGSFQLCTDALRLQSLAVPGIGLGSYAHCYTNHKGQSLKMSSTLLHRIQVVK